MAKSMPTNIRAPLFGTTFSLIVSVGVLYMSYLGSTYLMRYFKATSIIELKEAIQSRNYNVIRERLKDISDSNALSSFLLLNSDKKLTDAVTQVLILTSENKYSEASSILNKEALKGKISEENINELNSMFEEGNKLVKETLNKKYELDTLTIDQELIGEYEQTFRQLKDLLNLDRKSPADSSLKFYDAGILAFLPVIPELPTSPETKDELFSKIFPEKISIEKKSEIIKGLDALRASSAILKNKIFKKVSIKEEKEVSLKNSENALRKFNEKAFDEISTLIIDTFERT